MYKLYLTCPQGIELLLADEAKTLGLENVKPLKAAVIGEGSIETAYRLCLWSRLANRVLLSIREFQIAEPDDLYHGLLDIEWSDHLDVHSTFSITFTGKGNGINNTHFGALKSKDAIVDYFTQRHNKRPNVDKTQPDLKIHVHLERAKVSVSLDLSGDSLHMRGYRRQQGAAPLKENLAAAILMRCKWPELMREKQALVDPMCGSATFLIEGAMMAADIAPNLTRQHWGFEGWLGHVPALWRRLIEEANERAQAGKAQAPLWIRGYEADPRLIQPARNNIERAGLSDWVKVYQGDLSTFSPNTDQQQTGLVVVNPPYGERLGDVKSLMYLYQHLGSQLRESCQGWKAGIFTGNPDLGKRMGIRSQKQYAFKNGAIDCKLILLDIQEKNFVLDKTHSGPKIPDPTSDTPLSPGAVMFANRVKKNRQRLKKWLNKESIECYRLYDADIPEYAVAVDVYGDHVHVQEYAPPKDIPLQKAQERLLDVALALPRVLDLPQENIVFKQREKQSGKKQYERLDQKRTYIEVNEHGAKLLINLNDYLDTGLFLDHRPLRYKVQQTAKNKHFLNLFCYTATATVHAALGGARTSTSVDLSNTYLEWGRKNLALNGFSDKHSLIKADVIAWLEKTVRNPNRQFYDIIFLDPPTFSNSKSTENSFDVQTDHSHMIRLAMRCLSKDGVLYFSNNYRRFKLDPELESDYAITDITKDTLGPDFERNTKIHKAWEIRHIL